MEDLRRLSQQPTVNASSDLLLLVRFICAVQTLRYASQQVYDPPINFILMEASWHDVVLEEDSNLHNLWISELDCLNSKASACSRLRVQSSVNSSFQNRSSTFLSCVLLHWRGHGGTGQPPIRAETSCWVSCKTVEYSWRWWAVWEWTKDDKSAGNLTRRIFCSSILLSDKTVDAPPPLFRNPG